MLLSQILTLQNSKFCYYVGNNAENYDTAISSSVTAEIHDTALLKLSLQNATILVSQIVKMQNTKI